MGLIDIIISIAIIAIAFWSIFQVALLCTSVMRESEKRETAVYLAEEAIEVVRFLRDESWSSNIAPVTTEADYFPVISGTDWMLTTTDPGPVSQLYRRIVKFDNVYRDANDDISDSGTEDPDSRKVIISILWDDPQKEYKIVTYLTNFLFN